MLKEVEGIVTTTTIFCKVLAMEIDPEKVKVSQIMTPSPLVTTTPDSTCLEAAELMIKHGVRRLPVVKGGALVGIVTSKDLLHCVR